MQSILKFFVGEFLISVLRKARAFSISGIGRYETYSLLSTLWCRFKSSFALKICTLVPWQLAYSSNSTQLIMLVCQFIKPFNPSFSIVEKFISSLLQVTGLCLVGWFLYEDFWLGEFQFNYSRDHGNLPKEWPRERKTDTARQIHDCPLNKKSIWFINVFVTLNNFKIFCIRKTKFNLKSPMPLK